MGINQSGDWQNKMLGRYRLLRLLGRGGMGEVWLAEDTQLRRQVAVKLLPRVSVAERSYLKDFEHEARAAATLEHPHILPIHDFGEQQVAEDEIVTYLITPYISGGSLRDRIRSIGGPLPGDEAMSYLRQAAEAYASRHGEAGSATYRAAWLRFSQRIRSIDDLRRIRASAARRKATGTKAPTAPAKQGTRAPNRADTRRGEMAARRVAVTP